MKKVKKPGIKHPLAIRWFHWINFPVLGVMVWSGLLIYWANSVYKIGFGDRTLLKFFPDTFYKALHIDHRLSEGMAYHFLFMWLFFLNGLIYVLYTIFSGEWRVLVPKRSSWKEAWQVLLHDLRIRKSKPAQGKYNAAQRIAYSAIILMGIGSILTGLAIYKPVQLEWLCAVFGGYKMARIFHFALTIGYVLFFLFHIVQVAIAGWKNFKAMITGAEESKKRKTLISFAFFLLFIGGSIGAWKWLRHRPIESGKTSAPLRSVMNMNENVFNALLSDKHLAKQYARSQSANPARINGMVGLRKALDSSNWELNIIKANGDTVKMNLDAIHRLPKTEIVFNFKCIEGWSQITWWAGVKFSDFMKAAGLKNESEMKYLGLATPDKEYYVGIDMPSALHPQTLLAYELNGKPLPLLQGYPLRLIIPVKYGVKSLKRIGYMYFDNKRTPDYWADKFGYDYYTGL